jgi:hypothetical protein
LYSIILGLKPQGTKSKKYLFIYWIAFFWQGQSWVLSCLILIP